MPRLTFFYIVEPPEYEIMACTLLASIRTHFGSDVTAIGYCPEDRMAELHPAVFKAHEMMGAEIRPMKTEGMWDEPYPHGNKIVATLQPRDSEYSAFIDSDVLFLRANSPEKLIREGHVSCSVAASMVWAPKDIWDQVYSIFDMPVPSERVRLMRQRHRSIPYYSSGLVVFPENAGSQGRFADVWYDTARMIDRVETIPKRRPYLDQLSLPVAIRRAGLDWNELPEEQHFILGGKLRNKPLPADREIYTVHYRADVILEEVGLRRTGQRMLREQTGVRFVRRLTANQQADDENADA